MPPVYEASVNAPWKVYPVKWEAYFSGAKPIPLWSTEKKARFLSANSAYPAMPFAMDANHSLAYFTGVGPEDLTRASLVLPAPGREVNIKPKLQPLFPTITPFHK